MVHIKSFLLHLNLKSTISIEAMSFIILRLTKTNIMNEKQVTTFKALNLAYIIYYRYISYHMIHMPHMICDVQSYSYEVE